MSTKANEILQNLGEAMHGQVLNALEKGPMSPSRLKDLIGGDEAEIDSAIKDLMDDGDIEQAETGELSLSNEVES